MRAVKMRINQYGEIENPGRGDAEEVLEHKVVHGEDHRVL